MYKQKPEIAAAFRARALRCTPQRYAVLDYLMRFRGHATADEIFHALDGDWPQASRATVYNNLHALVRAGLIREVVLEGKAVRFDANIERHHHFVCEQCGRLEDIDWFDLPPLAAGSLRGSQIIRDYQVVFRGTCAICSRNQHYRRGDKHGKSRQTGCGAGRRQRGRARG